MTDKTTPALLKDILGPKALAIIADAGASASSRFDHAGFLSAASIGLDTLSIMERVRHIADALYVALPRQYMDALEIIRAMMPSLTHGFQAIAVTEYVARYGLGDFDRSMDALTDLTRFGSAEFAIRPFLLQDSERTLAVMKRWTSSADEHVRRLASEGSRPRLPWASRIPALRDDPTLAAQRLDVRRSQGALVGASKKFYEALDLLGRAAGSSINRLRFPPGPRVGCLRRRIPQSSPAVGACRSGIRGGAGARLALVCS